MLPMLDISSLGVAAAREVGPAPWENPPVRSPRLATPALVRAVHTSLTATSLLSIVVDLPNAATFSRAAVVRSFCAVVRSFCAAARG